METTRQFLNRRQPQTLQSATILLYFNAVFALLNLRNDPTAVLALVGGFMGYGIANDKKWGWLGGLIVSALQAAFFLWFLTLAGPGFNIFVSLAFKVLLVYVLIHPMSRDYKQLWFK